MARVGRTTIVRYALPVLGFAFGFGLFKIYLLKFATDVLLVAPATMGLILAASRLWDAATDPIAGYWSDRTRSRFGRRRPWIVASTAPLAAATLALWSPPAGLQGAGLAAWMAAATMLFFVGSTTFAVPHRALGAELAFDHHERSRLFAGWTAGELMGGVIAIGCLAVIERSPDPRATAVPIAALAAGSMLVLVLSCVPWLPEPVAHRDLGASRFAGAAIDVWRNARARILLVAIFLGEFALNAVVVLLPYMTEYVWGMSGDTALFLGCTGAGAAMGVPLALRVSRRIGKTRTWSAAGYAMAGGFAGNFFVREGAFEVGIPASLAIGLGVGCVMVLAPSVQSDVIDWDEYRTGERKEGSYFAFWGLALKAAIALAMATTGFVLQASGFRAGIAQSPETLLALRTYFALVPAVLVSIGATLVLFLRLDEREHARVRAAADARRTARAGSAPLA